MDKLTVADIIRRGSGAKAVLEAHKNLILALREFSALSPEHEQRAEDFITEQVFNLNTRHKLLTPLHEMQEKSEEIQGIVQQQLQSYRNKLLTRTQDLLA